MSDSTKLSADESAYIKKTGGGIRMLVIKVSNLDEAVEKFRQKGIEPIAFMIHGEDKEAHYDPKDTFGITICLNEYPDIHPMNHIARTYFKEKEKK